VAIEDFESQCWGTLGLGMALLDNACPDHPGINQVLSSRFHQWWGRVNTRPTFFMS
jgi:hypothetical protein